MPIKTITSKSNPDFRRLCGLADHPRFRRETGQTLLDGEHLIQDARAAGIPLRQLVFSEAFSAASEWQALTVETETRVLPEALFRKLSPVAHSTGVMAVIDIPQRRDPGGNFIVLLDSVQDPGNLGALLRTAAAAGVEAAFLSRGCAEAWSPKALRGGQGAQFCIAIGESVDLADVVAAFEGPVLAAVLGAGRSLYEMPLSGRVAFAFGNEGAGLSPALQDLATPFSIPMAAGVESLNVAAAAAVCLFERSRQCGFVRGSAK